MNEASTSSPTLYRIRFSHLQVEAFPDLLADGPAEGSPAARFVAQTAYADTVRVLKEEAREGREGELFSLPCKPGTERFNSFWTHYLGGRTLGQDPKGDWKRFVPLRHTVPACASEAAAGEVEGLAVAVEGWGASPRVETFLYPHGAGVVVTTDLLGELEPEAAAASLREVRHHAGARLVGDAPGEARYNVEHLSTAVLDHVRRWIGGPRTPSVRLPPFTLATVIQGSWDRPSRVEPDDPLHRVLESLCTGDRVFPGSLSAEVLQRRSLDVKSGRPPEWLLYGTERGRAVWFPGHFTASVGRRSPLGCYHRNLTLLSLQVESLLALNEVGLKMLRDARGIRSPFLESRVRAAARQVKILYDGFDHASWEQTYRSSSARSQVDAGDRKERLNRLRDLLGLADRF